MSTIGNFLSVSGFQENKRKAEVEAKGQENAIKEKLRRNGVDFPKYHFLELIGKGSFGRVYKAYDEQNLRLVALKVLDADSTDYKAPKPNKDATIDDTIHEIKVLRALKDSGAKNVNMFFDAFHVHSQLWIVNDYCPGGSVRTLMRPTENNKLSEKYIIPIARELAIGLKSVHDADIIHRDVKCANVMIHENGSLQLIDFGVAGILQSKVDKRRTVIGTGHWMAPELLKAGFSGWLSHGTEVDVWAFGCTLYECATGAPPHATTKQTELMYRLRDGPPRLEDDRYSKELRDLIAFVLEPDPKKRPNMEAILQHPYILGSEEKYPTKSLVELVKIYHKWESAGGQRSSLFAPYGAAAVEFPQYKSSEEEEWNFSTTASFAQQYTPNEEDMGDFRYLPTHQRPLETSQDSFDPFADSLKNDAYFQHNDADPRGIESQNTPSLASSGLGEESTPSASQFNLQISRSFSPTSSSYSQPANGSVEDSPPSVAQDDSVRRGERSLNNIFSRDLPLRSGQNSSTHHQEVDFNANGAPAKTPLNLEKKKLQEWRFSKAAKAHQKSQTLSSPQQSRPPLIHSATAPVPDRPISGTLDLDALMNEDSTPFRPLSGTLDLDALMNQGSSPPRPVSGILDLDTMMNLTGPPDRPVSGTLDLDALMNDDSTPALYSAYNTPFHSASTSRTNYTHSASTSMSFSTDYFEGESYSADDLGYTLRAANPIGNERAHQAFNDKVLEEEPDFSFPMPRMPDAKALQENARPDVVIPALEFQLTELGSFWGEISRQLEGMGMGELGEGGSEVDQGYSGEGDTEGEE